MDINDTKSHLVIEGDKSNNNTVVHCAALEYRNHRFVAWISSQKALFVVLSTVQLPWLFTGSADHRVLSTQPQMVQSMRFNTRITAAHMYNSTTSQHQAMPRSTKGVIFFMYTSLLCTFSIYFVPLCSCIIIHCPLYIHAYMIVYPLAVSPGSEHRRQFSPSKPTP